MAATAIFDLSRRVHEDEDMQLKAQRITEENELQRQTLHDQQASEFQHLYQPSPAQYQQQTQPIAPPSALRKQHVDISLNVTKNALKTI